MLDENLSTHNPSMILNITSLNFGKTANKAPLKLAILFVHIKDLSLIILPQYKILFSKLRVDQQPSTCPGPANFAMLPSILRAQLPEP